MLDVLVELEGQFGGDDPEAREVGFFWKMEELELERGQAPVVFESANLKKRSRIGMDNELMLLAPLSALIGVMSVCLGIIVIGLTLLYCCHQDLANLKEAKKALEDKVEELKGKLEHMAVAKIQSETERVLLQYYALERGGLIRRRVRSSSDVSIGGGLAG